ncbi:HNH endonuclease [Metabacillus fastidiosus]|uniref:HNH endonuclease n=1 Tax=Metabacillus fastidiosus TaxID=1458 RepID=UPI003D2D824F
MSLVCDLRTKKEKRLRINYNETHKFINGVEYKYCTGCEDWHPMNEEWFYPNKSSPDNFNPYCKEFTKKKSSKWIRENKERHHKSQFKFYNSEHGRKLRREEAKRRRDNGNYSKWRKETNYTFDRSDKIHEISDHEWMMCKEYFNSSCAYCGLHADDHLVMWSGKLKKIDLSREHVDDKGSNKIDNCVPACRICNSSKKDFEFEFWYKERSPHYTEERYNKIKQWLEFDHKKYIDK